MVNEVAVTQTIIHSPTGEKFLPVPISTLRVDTVTDFDIYLVLKPDQAPVLYRHKDLSFTDEARERLEENKLKVVYVDSRQEDAYRKYVERNLGSLLADASVALDTKTAVLYSSACGLVKDLLTDPRSGDVMPRSAEFIGHTTEFMIRERRGALESLMKVTSFDYYTYTHSVNVFVFGVLLAQRTGVDSALLKRYGLGALLHDLGKSLMDPAILNCKGKLSDAQWDIMRKHPIYGVDLLGEQRVTDELVLDVVRHHHEKLTGNGYPDGLKAQDISQFSRITTIADIFDALTTKRSYKGALHSFPALKLMKDNMRAEIDPELFRTFVVMIGSPSG